MRDERYTLELLGGQHDRAAFRCGVPALDRYLREQAGQEIRRHLAAVYVLVERTTAAIVGYYTLSATGIDANTLPPELVRRLPRYPRLPAILIGRLAVDQHYRGQRLGRGLLLDALARSYHESARIGALAVVVEAKDDTARQFYQYFGFHLLVDDQDRLFITMQAIAALALPAPP